LELPFLSLPRNHEGEVDLHRPYIDNFVFESSSGKKMKRVPEVMDVWFDSGAMPFAQNHYPFENKEWVDTKGYPADYISEAIDQTRGWFYTLHAIGVLLGRGNAYKNVICLGHILDKDGLKMSKSKGNTVNPWEAIEKYGVDPLRYWMYTINQPGESKNFDIRTVDDVVKKVFNLVLNVLKFYEMCLNNEYHKHLSYLKVLEFHLAL
jgi:isoleucyl-tRNA synthetase